MIGTVLLLILGGDVIAAGSGDIDQSASAAPAAAEGIGPATLAIAAVGLAVAVMIMVRGAWRLDAAPKRALIDPVIAGSAAILLFLAPSLVVSFMPPEPTTLEDHARAFGWASIARGAVIVGWAVLIAQSWARRTPESGSESGSEPVMSIGRAAGLGGLGLLATWPVVLAVGTLAGYIVMLLGGEANPVAHDTLQQLVDSPVTRWTWAVAAFAVIVAPITEEVLYRGMLQEALRSSPFGAWGAIVVTSVLFALMHVGNSAPHAVAGLFVLSLGFGWVYERSGRLVAPIVMHLGFNAGNFGLAMVMHAST